MKTLAVIVVLILPLILLLPSAGAVPLSSSTPCAVAVPLSSSTSPAAALLAKCARAYDALHSYECHIDAATNTRHGTMYYSTADIVFKRPGKILASGFNMVGRSYGYFSDGKTSMQFMTGTWTKASSIETAISGATGIAQCAATTIPALLVHTEWGYPFWPFQTVNPHVDEVTVDGRSCYQIMITAPVVQTFWIDRNTFLLDKVLTKIETNFWSEDNTLTITNERINPVVSDTVFTKSV